MPTEREVIETLAKAIGYSYFYHDMNYVQKNNDDGFDLVHWNPLTSRDDLAEVEAVIAKDVDMAFAYNERLRGMFGNSTKNRQLKTRLLPTNKCAMAAYQVLKGDVR